MSVVELQELITRKVKTTENESVLEEVKNILLKAEQGNKVIDVMKYADELLTQHHEVLKRLA